MVTLSLLMLPLTCKDNLTIPLAGWHPDVVNQDFNLYVALQQSSFNKKIRGYTTNLLKFS